jgi:enoyl-CoA hydratase/carnithine racemase
MLTADRGGALPESDHLLLEIADAVAVLILNRPDDGNALTASLLEALAEKLDQLASQGEARCVVLKGAGKRFSVGMDLNVMASGTAEDNQRLIGPGGPLRGAMQAVEEYPYPVVAMIKGHAAGAACELAVACDLRVGCEGSRMGMPPAKLGIVYPMEGLERFLRTVGLNTTRKLFYTARYFKGPELLRMGMLDFLCTDDELVSYTMEVAGQLAANAPLSMKGHKKILRLLLEGSQVSPEVAAEINAMVTEAMGSTDAIEGVVAFKQKRPPEFRS